MSKLLHRILLKSFALLTDGLDLARQLDLHGACARDKLKYFPVLASLDGTTYPIVLSQRLVGVHGIVDSALHVVHERLRGAADQNGSDGAPLAFLVEDDDIRVPDLLGVHLIAYAERFRWRAALDCAG